MEDYKPVCTPMVIGCILISNEKSPIVNQPAYSLISNDESLTVNQPAYRSMIGSLHCLTSTRPDIMNAVGIVARFQSNPKESHLQGIKKIKYLQGTQEFFLWYPKDIDLTFQAYTDADWAGNVDDQKNH